MGAHHTETLELQGTYAIVLEVLGRLQEAADVYQQVILAQTDLFGAAHATTLLTKMNLGVLSAARLATLACRNLCSSKRHKGSRKRWARSVPTHRRPCETWRV